MKSRLAPIAAIIIITSGFNPTIGAKGISKGIIKALLAVFETNIVTKTLIIEIASTTRNKGWPAIKS